MADNKLQRLKSLSPLDGRYGDKLNEVREIFSEESLIKQRLRVEVEYLIKLVRWLKVEKLDQKTEKKLKSWLKAVGDKEILAIKAEEKVINHDVKAVENYLKKQLEKMGKKQLSAWVHWGLTSEDVNNLAYGLMVKRAKETVMRETYKQLIDQLAKMCKRDKGVVMIARTHGQVAVPTTMGKEWLVFLKRISDWFKEMEAVKLTGKLNGAVGNLNAQVRVYPNKDWLGFSKKVVEGLGLEWEMVSTQIEPNTRLVKLLDVGRQINNVGLDLAKDCWLYISRDDLKLRVKPEEVGSSTMPQKVNPIDFENAEGNLEIANSFLLMMSNKLSMSRLQRDLSDSTVKRNIGAALGYSLLGIKSLIKGLTKVEPNKKKMLKEVEDHPEMMSEALQLYLKTKGESGAYEKVKEKVRGKKVSWEEMIEGLSQLQKQDLRKWLVKDYQGLAEKIVDKQLLLIKGLSK